ncbi:hypothetical protein RvY_05309, partial [Ramazzottius varieornatus]
TAYSSLTHLHTCATLYCIGYVSRFCLPTGYGSCWYPVVIDHVFVIRYQVLMVFVFCCR